MLTEIQTAIDNRLLEYGLINEKELKKKYSGGIYKELEYVKKNLLRIKVLIAANEAIERSENDTKYLQFYLSIMLSKGKEKRDFLAAIELVKKYRDAGFSNENVYKILNVGCNGTLEYDYFKMCLRFIDESN